MMNDFKKIMIDMWRAQGISDKTAERYMDLAMDMSIYERDIEIIKKRIDLSRKTVADLGCGWGSLALLLSRDGAIVTGVEHVPEHAEVTSMRAGCKTLTESVCNLSLEDNSFDVVISHSVIEHVDPCGLRGLCVKDDLKRAHVSEMARILKPGGEGFICTGNFEHPHDAETGHDYFHWYHPHVQEILLKQWGESADYYTLFIWDHLEEIIESAGLKITEVLDPDNPGENDPKSMASWFIFFEKEV